MLRCSREDLWCILPLDVVRNALGKLRLIWDGRWVNRHLPKEKFWMHCPLALQPVFGALCPLPAISKPCAGHHPIFERRDIRSRHLGQPARLKSLVTAIWVATGPPEYALAHSMRSSNSALLSATVASASRAAAGLPW
jgi:hypothetical protein